MKRLFLLLTFVGMLFTSCTEDGPVDEGGASGIKLSQQTIETEFEPGSYSVSVTSPQSWEAFSKNDWISVDSKQGAAGSAKLSFTISRNEEEEKRMGTIVLTNSEYDLVTELYVTQKAFVPEITIDTKTLTFSSKQEEKSVKVIANFSHSATSNADWLKVVKSENGYTISVPEYDKTVPRTAEITIKNDKYSISEVINVTQSAFEPSELVVEPWLLRFPMEGGEQSVKITSNYEYEVEESYDWLSCKKVDDGIVVNVVASDILDERTGYIFVSSPEEYGFVARIEVTQRGFEPSLVIEPESLNFSAQSGKQDIKVSSNFEYEATKSASWLTISRNDDGYTISVVENGKATSRSTEIIVKSKKAEYNVSKSVVITQDALVPEYEIGLHELNFDEFGGNQLIPFTANFTSYSVSENCDWLSCAKKNEGVMVWVDVSSVTEDRTAQITISKSDFGISEVVTVKQSAQDPGRIIYYTTTNKNAISASSVKISDNEMVYNEYNKNGAIVFSKPLTAIPAQMFMDCTRLSSIIIPEGVSSIGSEAFKDCECLTGITIPSSVTDIASNAFSGCRFQKDKIVNNSSVTTLGGAITYDIIQEDGLCINGTTAYYCRKSATNVTIPNSVTSLRNPIFKDHENLTSITIGSGITEIRNEEFSGCPLLAKVIISDSVTSIGSYAFFDCTSLTSITIPDSVTRILDNAFRDCKKLTSVTVGSGITRFIGPSFFKCPSLKTFYCKAIEPPITDLGFDLGLFSTGMGYTIPTIYVPTESVNAYKTSCYWEQYSEYIEGYDF